MTYTADNGDQVSLVRANDTKTVKEYATMDADDGFIDKQIPGYKAPDIPHAAIPGYSVYKVYTEEIVPDENGYPVLDWVEISTNEADYNHIHPLDRDDFLDVARKIQTLIPGAFIKRDVPIESISNPYRTNTKWRVVYKGSPLKPTFELPNEAPVVPALPEFHQALPDNAPVHELDAFEFAVPNEAPIVPALPEFHQAHPDNAPVHELDAFEFAVPKEAPIYPINEFVYEVPANAPINEVTVYEFKVPETAPIHDMVDFEFKVPETAPIHDIADFEFKVPETAPIHNIADFEYKVPETAPIHEITDFEYKVPETTPSEASIQEHVSNNSKQILPKTNSQSNIMLILFGFVMFIFGIYFRTTVKN